MNESIVKATLDAGGGVGATVYAIIAPEGAPLEKVVYQLIVETPENPLDGPYGFSNYRVQVDCYAATYARAMALHAACLAKLEAIGRMVSRNPIDPYDYETKSFRVSADYSLWLSRT